MEQTVPALPAFTIQHFYKKLLIVLITFLLLPGIAAASTIIQVDPQLQIVSEKAVKHAATIPAITNCVTHPAADKLKLVF